MLSDGRIGHLLDTYTPWWKVCLCVHNTAVLCVVKEVYVYVCACVCECMCGSVCVCVCVFSAATCVLYLL